MLWWRYVIAKYIHTLHFIEMRTKKATISHLVANSCVQSGIMIAHPMLPRQCERFKQFYYNLGESTAHPGRFCFRFVVKPNVQLMGYFAMQLTRGDNDKGPAQKPHHNK